MNDREPREREEGLFGTEEPAPKRENPYLRKNRHKTEAPDRLLSDKPLTPQPPAAPPHKDASSTPDHPTPHRGKSNSHKGNWWFEHVRLVTFLSILLAVLLLVGPFNIFDMISLADEKREEAERGEKDELTLAYIEALTHKSEPISWRDFARFYYQENRSEHRLVWMLPVGTDFELWVSGPGEHYAPDSAILYYMHGDDSVDILTGDLRAFLDKYT